MGFKSKMAFLAVPAAIFGTDGIVKRRIDRKMETDEQKDIFGGRLILQKHYNEGAALGIFASQPKAVLWIQGAFLSITAVYYALLLLKKERTGLKISLGMLLGGGMSNLYDRLKKRHVVDYIKIPSKNRRLSRIVFNISDIFIFAGTVLTAFLWDRKKKG